MNAGDGTLCFGIVDAYPSQLAQIEGLCAAFTRYKVSVEASAEIGSAAHDLYLVVIDPDAVPELEQMVVDAGFIPLLALTLRADDGVSDRLTLAGFCDCLVLETLDTRTLERAVGFALQRRLVMERMRMRESALIDAFEGRSQQLANSLHDVPLQDLIGARFLIGALGAGASTDEVQESLQSVIQFVRALCSELKPPALGPFGLEKAIRAHLQSFQTHNPDVNVSMEVESDQPQMPEWARYALFRIYQAAVDNVAKHANATQMSLRLKVDEEYMQLTVADDGHGFELPPDLLEFARSGRYGLLIMQERTDALRGRMMIQSTIGSGTRLTARVPLNQPPLPLSSSMESLVSASLLASQISSKAPAVQDRNG